MSNENENFIYFDRESGELMIKRSFIEDKYYKENWGHQMSDIVFELARLIGKVELLVKHMEPNTHPYWDAISLAQNIMQIYPNVHSRKNWDEVLGNVEDILEQEILVKEISQYESSTIREYFLKLREELQYHMKECTTQELD